MTDPTMSSTQRLDDLLDRWEDAQAAGRTLTAEALCADCPELLDSLRRRLAALQAVDDRLRTQSWAVASQPIGDAAEASLGDDVVPELDTRFDQIRFLAHGGLGSVFVARDTKLHREIALKCVRRKIAHDEPSIDRFLVEAEVTGRLDHPGIVPVYGLGRLPDGRPFYAMRYIQGESLDDAASRYHAETGKLDEGARRMALRKLLTHFVAACQTIAYAHRRGIVHRDMKPAHILLGRYGETLVVDWGLAVPVGREERFKDQLEQTLMPQAGSQTGSSTDGAGTPQYMSPEQAAGGVSLGPATDIYSLGVTLYKVLTGRVPFAAESFHDLRQKILRGDVPPPGRQARHVPQALEAICLKAMRRDPRDRYATALHLADDIERFFADEPISIVRETLSRRLARWARRNRSTAQGIVAGLVMIALTAALASVLLLQTSRRAQEARDMSLGTSATFAARMLGQEAEARWSALAFAAADPELHALLVRAADADDDDGRAKLYVDVEAWLQRRKAASDVRLPSGSWALLDARGVHLGRAAADGVRFPGRSFAHRSYFHGLPYELGEDELAKAVPLQSPAMSPAYESTVFTLPTVSFSVPVRAGEEILGVLTMSVTAAEFSALEVERRGGRRVLLIDDRPDSQRRTGLVLFDSSSSVQEKSKQAPAPRLYLAAEFQERLANPSAQSGERVLEHRTPLIADGTSAHVSQRWTAAWEPVVARRRSGSPESIGWTVVVEQND